MPKSSEPNQLKPKDGATPDGLLGAITLNNMDSVIAPGDHSPSGTVDKEIQIQTHMYTLLRKSGQVCLSRFAV